MVTATVVTVGTKAVNVVEALAAVYLELPAYDAVCVSNPALGGASEQRAVPAVSVVAVQLWSPRVKVTGALATGATGVALTSMRWALIVTGEPVLPA